MNVYLQCFLFGVAGDAAVELVRMLAYLQQGKWHRKYGDWRFWLARLIFLVVAGGLALALAIDGASSRMLAFHAGAAASLTVGWMSRRLPFKNEPAELGVMPRAEGRPTESS